jgi:hypothetical protein
MNKKITSITQRHAVLRHTAAASAAALICLAASIPCHAGQKPAGWEPTVNSAGEKKPVFWLDGTPEISRGEELSGEVRYIQKVWGEAQPGFWGEKGGAFGSAPDSRGVGVLKDSDSTTIGCSKNGAVAILFRTPSEFRFGRDLPPDKYLLFSRGNAGPISPFEIAVVNGAIRIATQGEGEKPNFVCLPKVPESSWCWFAMSWKTQNGSTEVQWRLLAPAKGGSIENGAFTTTGLGQVDSKVLIGGTQSAHSAMDTALSQVIVWDTPVSDGGWSKLEALLQ